VAYDHELARRIRFLAEGEPGLTEKRMFGGLAFLVNGRMALAASGQGGLLARADPALVDVLLSEPGVERAVMGGRTMHGWLRVAAADVADDDDLERWVRRCLDHAQALPPKR
jgi:TfoX/Sxy family transcriptional regulator of competence genes